MLVKKGFIQKSIDLHFNYIFSIFCIKMADDTCEGNKFVQVMILAKVIIIHCLFFLHLMNYRMVATLFRHQWELKC